MRAYGALRSPIAGAEGLATEARAEAGQAAA